MKTWAKDTLKKTGPKFPGIKDDIDGSIKSEAVTEALETAASNQLNSILKDPQPLPTEGGFDKAVKGAKDNIDKALNLEDPKKHPLPGDPPNKAGARQKKEEALKNLKDGKPEIGAEINKIIAKIDNLLKLEAEKKDDIAAKKDAIAELEALIKRVKDAKDKMKDALKLEQEAKENKDKAVGNIDKALAAYNSKRPALSHKNSGWETSLNNAKRNINQSMNSLDKSINKKGKAIQGLTNLQNGLQSALDDLNAALAAEQG
jgi:DNA repair exonuclease SbcCD ATPase subunit